MKNINIYPKVTAVVRTYNRSELLRKAINSVQKQDYPNLEIIIMDDCSTDNTALVAADLVNLDSRIIYFRQNVNCGTGAGFNAGINIANGKYIAFLDDDDLWRPNKTSDQVKKLQSLECEFGLITGGVDYFDLSTGQRLDMEFRPKEHDPNYKKILLDSISIIGPPSVVMLRLSLVKEFGLFRVDMPRGCCQEYYRRFLKKYKMTSVHTVCTDYAVHDKRITSYLVISDYKKAFICHKIKLESIENDLKMYPSEYSLELGKIGDIACLIKKITEGRCYLIRALKINPLRLKIWGALFLSFFGANIYRRLRFKNIR